jgi:hypothetical protein
MKSSDWARTRGWLFSMSTTHVDPLRWVERTTNFVTAGEISRRG